MHGLIWSYTNGDGAKSCILILLLESYEIIKSDGEEGLACWINNQIFGHIV